MKFATGRRADPFIDVTPMIDVVFQLVLFFMVSTTFINAPGIQVDLPRSSAQTIIAEKNDINVWMQCGKQLEGGSCTDGPVFVGNTPVTLDRLRTIFRNAAESDPDTLVVIKADQGVAHGRVVTTMDIAREEGLSRLAIATELPEKPQD